MALKIRLRRMGRKKAPTYRIVVAESSMPRDGRFVANLGHYNPRTEPMTLVVDREQVQYWISKGARPTDTVRSLLRRKEAVDRGEARAQRAAERAAGRPARQRVVEAATAVAQEAAAVAQEAVQAVTDAVETAVEAVQDAVAGEPEQPEPKAE
ncbi:MAG TPA: 30S ribosomal protein S16 [Longimicrobiaceae bacterium]|nr:30S ribosomal protein S16 [Longimicrobiaceae bacterium]